MAELQKVSWRTAGYALLGSALVAASVVAVVHSDGVHPTSLTSSAATRWLVYQPLKRVVLADGLSGRVLARIDATSDATDEVAVQGIGGAFLVAPARGSVRTISTAKLQLGTPQSVASLSQVGAKFGVGANGLTVVNSATDEANVVAVDDITRPIKVPKSDSSIVAADGSMWLLTKNQATHLNTDESSQSMQLPGTVDPALVTTVGSHAISFDSATRIVHWLDGGDVSVASIPNSSNAILQQPGDAAACVWLGADDTLACVGKSGIDRTVHIDGLHLQQDDRFAIAGAAAVVVRGTTSEIQRIDLEAGKLLVAANPTVANGAELTITSGNDMIWIDDQRGSSAWAIQRFGVSVIHKDDENTPLLDAQGQVKAGGAVAGVGSNDAITPSDVTANHLDDNNRDDPPVAVDDSVTARSGNSFTIPVTGNDYDPDGNAIGVSEVQPAGHGSTYVLDGTSVAYSPEQGFSGADEFKYTIVDEHGNSAMATVHVRLFAPDSPNQPPIAQPDHVKTRIGRPVTIDVLANDIDPERDTLTVPTFQQNSSGKITDTIGPSGLPALRYEPTTAVPGIYTFTYQAADPQGGTSANTPVFVDVSSDAAPNGAPTARADAVRLPVGKTVPLDVLANDVDPDGDELTIGSVSQPRGVTAVVRGSQLDITVGPGADALSVVVYTLKDGVAGHDRPGHVLVMRIDDSAPNRPPVANPDADRVVIGNSVKIPVTANDVDPDHDPIRLIAVEQPAAGGTTSIEGESVRFTPNLRDITEPTVVKFSYSISDGHEHERTGHVSVTVMAEALPRAPFARDDPADTVRDKRVTIDVLANDSDPSGGEPHLIGKPTCENGGTATPTADERVTFDPPQGEIGTFRCRYSIGNGQGLRATASIIVTVTEAPPGNPPPTIISGATQVTVDAGKQLTFTATDLADDLDGDPLVFVAVSQPSVGRTSFTHTSPSFTYTAPLPAPGSQVAQIDAIDVIISDQHGGNLPAVISIKINAPPVETTPASPVAPIAPPITRLATIGQPQDIEVLAQVLAANGGAAITLTSASLDPGSPDMGVTYDDRIVSITPVAAGAATITYIVTSSDRVTASGKIKVTVSAPPPDNPPIAVGDELTVSSGGTNSVNVLTNDGGIGDPGDIPSAQLLSPASSTFGDANLTGGTLTFNAAPDAAGPVVIKYTLTDGKGPPSTGTVRVTILACGESAPAVRAASVFTKYQTPIDIDLTQYVISGNIRADSVTGAGLTGPIGRYTPPAGMNGSETVTYVVENGCRQAVTGTLIIDVNKPPVGGTIAPNLAAGSTLTLLVTDVASDDEPLQITRIDGNPPWVSLGLANGFDSTVITAAPGPEIPVGTYPFTATVQDPGGLTATATIALTITNLPPIARADVYFLTPPIAAGTTAFQFDPTTNDSDPEDPGGHHLQVQFVESAVSLTGNTVTVNVSHGVSTFSYTVRDAGGLTASSTITITSDNPPTIVGGPITDRTNGSTLDDVLAARDADGGDVLHADCPSTANFNVQVKPDTSGPPDQQRFDLHITLDPDFAGTASFNCSVTDNLGPPVTAMVTVTKTD